VALVMGALCAIHAYLAYFFAIAGSEGVYVDANILMSCITGSVGAIAATLSGLPGGD